MRHLSLRAIWIGLLLSCPSAYSGPPPLTLTLPAVVTEGQTNLAGSVSIPDAASASLTVSLKADSAGQLALPASVVIAQGASSANFSFSAINNQDVDFARTVTVHAYRDGFDAKTTVQVYDDEPTTLTLNVPAQLEEHPNAPYGNASVAIDHPGIADLTVTLAADDPTQIKFPGTVTIKAGGVSAVFEYFANDDSRLDGDVLVTVRATAAGIPAATGQTTVLDNEPRTLTLNLPASVLEGASATGTVVMGGALSAPLTVQLTNSNPGAVTIPTSVVVAAGSNQASFTITAPNNDARDGGRGTTLSAAAGTFPVSTASLLVRDDDPAGYKIDALADYVNIAGFVRLGLTALDLEGAEINGFVGTVNLAVVLPSGETQPLTPGTATISGFYGWSGYVTFPALTGSGPFRVRVSDANGISTDSLPFRLTRGVTLATTDFLWDATRGRIFASVPATGGGVYANQVVAIDPVTGQVTGAVTTGSDPGPLALTGGGERLYVGLNASGQVAQIDPDALRVVSSFSLGVSSSGAPLSAQDLAPVAGQPNLLIVSQKSGDNAGVAVFEDGVARPNKIVRSFSDGANNLIEPSADPTLFFGYNSESTEFGFRQFRLDASGLTQISSTADLLGGFYEIRSDGNRVFIGYGSDIDGRQLRALGSFPAKGSIWPELSANRVFIAEKDAYGDTYSKVSAYDPTTHAPTGHFTFTPAITPAATRGISTRNFIRWGASGFALRSAGSISLIDSPTLAPNGAPANLLVGVQATPALPVRGALLRYTITVTNQGPNVAPRATVSAAFSDGQAVSNAASPGGNPLVTGSAVSLAIGDLASGASVRLLVDTLPTSRGVVTCVACATSEALDPDSTDNVASRLVSVGYSLEVDALASLRLPANNLINDESRGLLWASLPAPAGEGLSASIISINPRTGAMTGPIPLPANPARETLALSPNGRYLYVGFTDLPEVARVDLASKPPTVARISLGVDQRGEPFPRRAIDIEALPGDGRSFLMVYSGDNAAYVFDDAVRRPDGSGIYTVTQVEKTGTPGRFIGFNGATSAFDFRALSITATGVSALGSAENVIGGFNSVLRGAGNLALSSSGQLADSSALTRKFDFQLTGTPCLDLENGRAYVVNGSGAQAFDTASGQPAGAAPLPTGLAGDWAYGCVRWGLDGLAVLGGNGRLYLERWSGAIPSSVDANADGVSDAWEAKYFDALDVDLAADADGDGISNGFEYLFNSSPLLATASPVSVAPTLTTSRAGTRALRLTFPRRAGVGAAFYGYEVSENLAQWTAAAGVVETVLSTQTSGGVIIETVAADIPVSGPAAFVRLRSPMP